MCIALPTHLNGSVAQYLDMNLKDRVKNIRSLRDEAGKFTKAQAYYADDAPLQKAARCGNCVYYDSANAQCDIVSGEGEPGPGRISRQGACSLWNAGPGRITAIQWLWGRDELDGVPPENIRATAYMFTYAGLDETPPKELREKSLIDFEKIDTRVPNIILDKLEL